MNIAGDEYGMNTKEQVIEILYNSNNMEASGEEIAKKLNISRNSVWKAVNSLKKEGYNICSMANGYKLNFEGEHFSCGSIKKYLKGDYDVVFYDSVDSTNNVAKELAGKGYSEGTVVVSRSQTSGKGRMGRSFISTSENGLYFTIILRPKISIDKSVNITVIGAVALCEAISEICNIPCEIKWVNDIYINGKKVSGILTEAAIDFESGVMQYAVIGMGINVYEPVGGFDNEIKDIATSIYKEKTSGEIKSRLCAKIIDRFFYHYEKIEEMEYIKKYREKSMIIGKTVDVYVGNQIINGVAIDIDENANLVVKTEKGIQKFNSGEARVLKNEKN